MDLVPKQIDNLSIYKKERLSELLIKLRDNKLIEGVLLGGSVSYQNKIEKSDIDLFCLVRGFNKFVNNLKKDFYDLIEIDVIINQGYFPWLGELFTFYYKNDLDFSIDVCLINIKNVKTFFWEPDGFILWDKNGFIDSSRESQMSDPHYTKQAFLKPNPFSLAVITLKKIKKNLLREHLWNALEQISIFRRFIMQIIRLSVIGDKNFLGRVDRDIEKVIPADINETLIKTVAKYDKSEIASKAIALSKIMESLITHFDEKKEENISGWVVKQMEFERREINQFIK